MSVSTTLRCVTDSISTHPRPRFSGAPQVDGNIIPQVPGTCWFVVTSTVCELGIYLDCDASMKSHVSKTVANCFAALDKFTTSEVPSRDRCCRRWFQHWSCRDWTTVVRRWPVCRPIYSTDYIQSVLDAAARLVHWARKHDHVKPLLRDLHYLRIRQRIDYELAVLIFRCLYGLAPSYFTEGLPRVSEFVSWRHLRSASSYVFVIPPEVDSEARARGRCRSLGTEAPQLDPGAEPLVGVRGQRRPKMRVWWRSLTYYDYLTVDLKCLILHVL